MLGFGLHVSYLYFVYDIIIIIKVRYTFAGVGRRKSGLL